MRDPAATPASARRVLIASLVGTAVELFDFHIFTTAASLVFGKVFFPTSSPAAQQFLSYATFGIAFIARPIGALLFGHFGDRLGRKSTLVVSLLTMGIATIAIGVLPGYDTIGWAAPAILCVLRFAQGLGIGGEWGGAVLLAVENAPPGHRARYGMFPQFGAPLGFMAGTATFLLLGLIVAPQQFESWAWRLPFLASAILVGIGLWVRLRLTETPEFEAAMSRAAPAPMPILELVRDYPRQVICGTLALTVAFAIFYLSTAFALGYGTKALHFDRQAFLGIQIIAISFMIVGTLIAGPWADRSNPRQVILIGCGMTLAPGLLLAPLMGSGSLALVCLLLSLSLLVVGIHHGPSSTFLSGLFPPRVRYTGSAVCYSLAGIVGGGFTPVVAQALVAQGGLPFVGYYVMGLGLVSTLALIALRPEARTAAA